ncbi:MAG: succinylglutamate desuccinylase/aspartoacylase family protein [Saprospiraceae bacterium]
MHSSSLIQNIKANNNSIIDMKPERIIGKYTGAEKGPLVIVIGGMHGNEPAGLRALERMFKMLELEPEHNPAFEFKGCLLGIRGNTQSIEKEVRFIDKDFNRIWTNEQVAKVKASSIEDLKNEDLELREMIDLLEAEIKAYQPEKIILLDLHTTTAHGGIFSIPSDTEDSLKLAVELHAPVVLGLLEGIEGTLLHYFRTENTGVETISIAFESGQHNEILSINRAIAAITNCLRTVGCVRAEHVENRHDQLLISYSKNLPKVTRLVDVHHIKAGDRFEMKPGYTNFQKVKKGEPLAHDINGAIYAQEEALVLMPLYQPIGSDGFFLVRGVEF